MDWAQIFSKLTTFTIFCTVWKNEKFTLASKYFVKQVINAIQYKMGLKNSWVNFSNFHTVLSYHAACYYLGLLRSGSIQYRKGPCFAAQKPGCRVFFQSTQCGNHRNLLSHFFWQNFLWKLYFPKEITEELIWRNIFRWEWIFKFSALYTK